MMYKKVWQAVCYVYRLDKKRFIINYGLFIFNALLSVLGIYLLQLFLATLQNYLSNQSTLYYLLGVFVIFLLSRIIYYVSHGLVGYYSEVYILILMKKIEHQLFTKKIAPIHYEEKAFLDLQEQAMQGGDKIIPITNVYIDLVFMYGSELLFLTIYLFLLHPAFVLIIGLILIVQIFNDKRSKQLNNELETKIHNLRRKKTYFSDLFMQKATMKEIKVLRSDNFLIQKLKINTKQLFDFEQRYYSLLFYKNIRYGVLKLSVYILSFSLVYFYRMQVSLAQFSALFLIMESIFKLAEEGFTTRLENVNKYLPKLEPFFQYLNFKEEIIVKHKKTEIILDNVSFQYPNSNNYALKNITLHLPLNQKIGIVGRNGSGKSTLMKLIAQIYPPTKGMIFSSDVSVVMQDFIKYELSAVDNVQLGDIQQLVDTEKFQAIDFPGNIDYKKIISKSFSDVDLSQGQWQKLAILRGLHKQNTYLLFDEPTWAIDPIMEKQVFDYLYDEVNGGMLVVTHNLRLVKKLDYIIVIDHGEIVGFDTHNQLIKTNKIYQALWESTQ